MIARLSRRLGVLASVAVIVMALAPAVEAQQTEAGWYQSGTSYGSGDQPATASIGLDGTIRASVYYNRRTGEFWVTDAETDGRYAWGRLATCSWRNEHDVCGSWSRRATLMAPPSATATQPVNLPPGKVFRIQACSSRRHLPEDMDRCSALYYGFA